MYHIKPFTDISELQLHIKSLLVEAKKCIEDQSQVNQKMYFYNFQKVSLKLHKFTIEFMAHLTINQKVKNIFQQIRYIFNVLNKTAKDKKARSSRTTYLSEDMFGFIPSSHQLNESSQNSTKQKQKLDIIEQFMIKRNHQIQSNAFGQVDQVFKIRQRNGLEEFLSHANNQAKNLQNHLKTASVQRKNIVSMSKKGGTKKKLFDKKYTFDLERINELDANNKNYQEAFVSFGSSFVDQIEKVDQQVQTILSNQNIIWSKVLTYCIKLPPFEEENETVYLREIYGNQVYRQYQKTMLSASQTQTQRMEQKLVLKQMSVQVRKQTTKKPTTKRVKKVTQNPSKMKSKKQKQKQTKAKLVDAKDQQKEQSLILNQNPTNFQAQKRGFNLQTQFQVVNEHFDPQILKQNMVNTQKAVSFLSRSQKKSGKAVQPWQMVFELKSKKQINQEKRAELHQSFRKPKKNKTMICHSRSAQKMIVAPKNPTEKQIFYLIKPGVEVKKCKEQFDQKNLNKEGYEKKRRTDKNLTWKEFLDSSLTNFKPTVKINDSKSDHSLKKDSLNLSTLRSESKNREQNKIKSSNISKSSNFKQLHEKISPDNVSRAQKKTLINKRNTIDQMMVSSELQTQMNSMINQLKGNGNNPNLIKQQQCQVSKKKILQQQTQPNVAQNDGNKNGKSKRTQNSSQQPNTQTKRTQEILQPLYDRPLLKKQFFATAVIYKKPSQLNQPEQSSKSLKNQSLKKERNYLPVKIFGKQQDDEKNVNTFRINRKSRTLHNSQPNNNKTFFTINKKGHKKNITQGLPDLSSCKQKLSDIKKSFSKDWLKNSESIHVESVMYTQNLMKNTFLSSEIKNSQHEMRQRETNETKLSNKQKQNKAVIKLEELPKLKLYQKMVQVEQVKPGKQEKERQQKQPDEESPVIKTIRRLLMTNSYRDKLLLYLSMIEVMHEKCCGKNCEHVNKFMRDMTGAVDVAQESVAKQLLKMYNTRKVNFQDVTNMWL